MSQYNTKQGETLLRFLKENSSRHFTAAEIETQLAIGANSPNAGRNRRFFG